MIFILPVVFIQLRFVRIFRFLHFYSIFKKTAIWDFPGFKNLCDCGSTTTGWQAVCFAPSYDYKNKFQYGNFLNVKYISINHKVS